MSLPGSFEYFHNVLRLLHYPQMFLLAKQVYSNSVHLFFFAEQHVELREFGRHGSVAVGVRRGDGQRAAFLRERPVVGGGVAGAGRSLLADRHQVGGFRKTGRASGVQYTLRDGGRSDHPSSAR